MALIAGLTLVVAPTPTPGANASIAGAADAAYTVLSLHFKVAVGPHNDSICDIVGDLYVPSDATRMHPVPALLMSNGWGGSKDDQAGIARAFALRDYAALTYSGLGWGGSSCKIQIDDPQWDGKAAARLVSYLGGARGIAYLDAAHTRSASPLGVVIHDARDHDGLRRRYDPRVGMVGGSYGGGVQFAAADVDHRVDTIVPMVTWNDLSYSIAPNGTSTTKGVSTATSGAFKTIYGTGFLGTGIAGAATGPTDPARLLTCPDLVDRFCLDIATATATGYQAPDAVAFYRAHSVASYLHNIKIPVLLIQGETDTLFNLNEAVATYRGLKAQKTPVKMMWASWGHSNGAVGAPGEFDFVHPDLTNQYDWQRIYAWLQHYLRNKPGATGPEFSYFRDWVGYTGSARPAYGTSSSYPVGTDRTFYLSGDGTLVSSPNDVVPGSQSLLTPPAGTPTSLDPLDLLTASAPTAPAPETDAPGTAVSWTTPALTSPLAVVGIPKATVRVEAPAAAAAQSAGPAGDLVLFVKLLDVAPDGTANLIRYQNMPVRIPDVTRPLHIALGGIVHRFAAGHRLRLTVAGGSVNYRGNLVPDVVTITSTANQTLRLPVLR